MALNCDATGAIKPTDCKYGKKIGTTFSQEISESISVSETIEYSLTANFFELFSETLSVSATTGYDWTQASSFTKSEMEEFEVIATAPAGLILTVEQAVGKCGDSEARTELFRIRHTDEKGNIVYTAYENGTK